PASDTASPATDAPVATPAPVSTALIRSGAANPRQLAVGRPTHGGKQLPASLQLVQEQSRKLGVSLFLREQSPVRSVGFTSAVAAGGRSFLALMPAAVLAQDSTEPVLLLDVNWEHATLHEQLGLPATPGLAEWLGGECDEADVRHQVTENLS